MPPPRALRRGRLPPLMLLLAALMVIGLASVSHQKVPFRSFPAWIMHDHDPVRKKVFERIIARAPDMSGHQSTVAAAAHGCLCVTSYGCKTLCR